MSFVSEEELRKAIEGALSSSSIMTMETTKGMLQNDIDKFVYDVYPNQFYPRSLEFKEAWETEGQGIGAEMYYEPGNMSANPPVHASIVTGESVTGVLATWIFEGHGPGCFPGGGWNAARDAWGQLDKEMTKTKFRTMYEAGMTANGLPWKRSTGAVIKTKD